MNGHETNRTMPDAKKCPQCGATLPAGALEGLCPACLLAQGAATDTATQTGSTPFVPPTVEEVARLFPQLEILAFIGKGGMGAVYKARQPALDRVVALKILPPQAAAARFAERFNREARALAKLNHPNIVAVHEFGQVNGLPFFIMEYVDGLNLRQLEKAGRLSPREALQIVPQICEALQFAHDEGIVHRDIKPENILLDKKGRVKIADFGIAKIMGREPDDAGVTETRHAIGTPRYMAPEQVEKPATVDHRADIFSLGVVFYEMLTGELPLGKFAPPSRKVHVDVRLDEVVLRALEKEPELRFQQASEVKTAVDTIAGTAAVASKSPAPAARAQTVADWLHNGRYALGFLIAAILGPFILAAISPRPEPVVLFGVIASVLALVFGIMSWRERLGKVVVVMVGALFLVAVGNLLIFRIFIVPAERARMQADLASVREKARENAERLRLSHLIKSDYIGQAYFPLGDSIEITSVERSPQQIVVKGHYNLVSSDTARLALSISATSIADATGPWNSKQVKEISRGQGEFELIHDHLVPGLPHVSMYGTNGGESFASLYFGTQDEALREAQIKFHSPQSQNAASANEPASGPSGESQEILRLKLQAAELNLQEAERRRANGIIPQGEYDEAKFHRDLAAAELKGDAAQAARAKLDFAEAKLQNAETMRANGIMPQSDYDELKFQRDLAAAELKGDAIQAARAKLDYAEAKLKNAETMRANGIISQGDYDQAKLARDMEAARLRQLQEQNQEQKAK